MKKKLLSIFLTTALLISCFVFPTQAVYTTVTRDDFEAGNAGSFQDKSYVSSETSGLFVKSAETLYTDAGSLQNNIGYDGSTGFYMKPSVTHASGNYRKTALMTKGIMLPEDGAAVIEYKFKLPAALPTYSGAIICLSGVTSTGQKCFDYINSTAYSDNASLNIYSKKICDTENAENSFNYITGEWYTVVTKVSGTGTSRYVTTDVIDDTGELCLSATKTVTNNIAQDTTTNLWPVYIIGGILPEAAGVIVDDVSLTEYKNSLNVSMVKSSIEDGATEISCSPLITLTFDQEIDKTSASYVKLYKKDNEAEVTGLTSVDTALNRISFTADGLDKNTQYILDFSEVMSENGTALAGTSTISFTTADMSDMLFTEDDFETGNAGVFSSGSYSSSETSGLLVTSAEPLYYSMMSLKTGMGYGGSTGLYMNTTVKHSSGNSRKTAIMTKGITLPENGAAVLEYKFKIPETLPTYSGAIICLSGVTSTGQNSFDYIKSTSYSDNSSLNIYSKKICDTENTENSFNYIAGEWYTVVTKVSGTGTNRYVKTDVLDDTGELCLSATKTITNNIAQDTTTNLWPVYVIGNIVPGDIKVVVDDVSLTEYKYPMNISLTESSVTEGATEVSTSPTFTLKFNQPLKKNTVSRVKLYNAADKTEEISLFVIDTAFDRIRLAADGLKGKTRYTLDFSGVTSENGTTLVGTSTVTFTTSDISDVIFSEDNFETGTVGSIKNRSYVSSETSGLFIESLEELYASVVSVKSGEGYGGSTGLYMNTTAKHNSGNSRKAVIMTKGITLPENGAAVLEYKFRLPEALPNYSGAIICLSGVTSTGQNCFDYLNSTAYSDNASLSIYSKKICDTENTENSFNYVANEWYTVVTKVSGTGTSRFITTDVMDDTGKLCLSATKTITNNIAPDTTTNLWPVYVIGNIVPDDIKIVVDDVSLTEYKYPMNVSITDCSVSDGDTEVPYAPSFMLRFNQPIAKTAASKVKLYKAGDKSSEAELTVINTLFNRINLMSEELEGGVEYILDFSGVTSENGVSLKGSSTVNFTTTDRRGMLYYEDDFETAVPGTTGDNYTASDVLHTGMTEMQIIEGAGYKGSKAYRIDNDSTVTNLRIKEFEISEKEKLYVEYKFNVQSLVKAGSGNIYITANDPDNTDVTSEKGIFSLRYTDKLGWNFASADGEETLCGMETDKWYTCILVIGRKEQNGYLFDDGGKLIGSDSISLTLGEKVYSTIFATGENDANVLFDDVKIYRLSSHELELDKDNCTVHDGDTEVLPGVPVMLVFNQPLAATSEKSISLYKGNEMVSAEIVRIGGNAVRITPTEFLSGNTDYTIKIDSTIAPLSENTSLCPKSINFKVKQMYPVTAKSSDIAISTDGTLNSGIKTLTVINNGKAISDAVLAVAIYENNVLSKLVDFDIITNQTLTEGENTLTFTLTNTYSNVGSVELLLYESLGSMQSLMLAHQITR